MNRNLLKLLGIATFALACAAPAQAELLTFEDVAPGSYNALGSSYHGMTWNNAYAVVASDFGYLQGIPQGLVSGSHVVINGYFGESAIVSNTRFSFNSGYFTSFHGSDVQLTVEAWANWVLLGTQTFSLSDQAPTFISFDQSLFGNVHAVVFNNAPNALIFDDLRINENNVPEPATLALLGLGLLGGAVSRRKAQKND